MTVSKKQQASVNKYVRENYDRVLVTMPKGRKDEIKAHAEARGESVNAFINRAIDETMERDGCHHEIIVKGKCTACGKRLGESDGLFICAECQKKNNKE